MHGPMHAPFKASPSVCHWLPCALLLAIALAGCARPQNSAELKARALRYQQQGQTRAAIIELKNVLQANAQDGQARAMLGQLFLDSGDVLSAEQELRRALTLGVKNREVRVGLGQCLLRQGQFDKLLSEFPDDPHQADVLALRGLALLGQKKPDEAAAQFERALQLQPGLSMALLGQASLALSGHQTEQAMSSIAQALAAHPDDIDSLRMRGDLLRAQGKSDAALQSYLHILRVRPEYIQAHVDIANLYIQNRQFDAAQAQIAVARKIAPNGLLVAYVQALLDFRLGRLQAAADQLQQILRVAPDHMPSVLLAGAVQLSLGANLQAEQNLRKFLDANPGHLYAHKLMATLEIKNADPDAALGRLRPLLAQHPDDTELAALAGEASMHARQYEMAAQYFQQAIARAPQTAVLHTGLAMSRLALGENARAVAELEQASTLDSQATGADVMLVLVHLRDHEYDQALHTVQALARQQPANPLINNLQGAVMLARQDPPAARASFEAALSHDPLYLPALKNLTQLDQVEKKPEQARQRLETALSRAPKNTGIALALAQLSMAQGDPHLAMTQLSHALKNNPDAPQLVLMLARLELRGGDKQQARTRVRQLLADQPDNGEAWSLQAELQSQSGQHDAALDSLRQLAALQPRSAELQLRIATLQIAGNDLAGAQATLRKALDLQADFPAAQVALVRLLNDGKAYAEALRVAHNMQRMHPDAPLGLKLEGDIQMSQQQYAAALKLYERAFAINQSGVMLIPIHRALLQTGQTAQAEARMQRWLQAHPNDYLVRLYFAGSLLAAKRYPDAIVQYQQVVQQQPTQVIALNDLAWACQQQGDGRARSYAEQAYRLAPDNAAVLDTLGSILADQGDTARALPLLRKASGLAPAVADIRYHLGQALAKAGDKSGARSQLAPLLAVKDFSRKAEVQSLLSRL